MKNFLVKDFILYNYPCFSCGSKISLQATLANSSGYFYSTELSLVSQDSYDDNKFYDKNYNEYLYLPIYNKYFNKLDVKIFIKTNKFETNNNELKKYLSTSNIQLKNYCYKCETSISSNRLVFDFDKNIIKPLKIQNEVLYIREENSIHRIFSNYDNNNSSLISLFDEKELKFTLPLLTLGKYKSREKILNKIKVCLNFC